MKKYSVWQKVQIVLCFIVMLCLFMPLAWVSISPYGASQVLRGVLFEDAIASAIGSITWIQRTIFGGITLVGVLCMIRLLVIVFSRKSRDKKGVSLQNTSEGPIHISVPAVETLVSQGIRDVPGLSDVRMKICDDEDSISIEITMSARSDINIPDTMMKLQSRIKAYVQESAGIAVREVRLNVDKVVLADGIPSLPAGRAIKPAGSSEQEPTAQADYAPQTFTWKRDAAEPEVETHPVSETKQSETPAEKPQAFVFAAQPEPAPVSAPEPAPKAAAVEDDDDTDGDAGRKRGWFGRLGHKKREEEITAPRADDMREFKPAPITPKPAESEPKSEAAFEPEISAPRSAPETARENVGESEALAAESEIPKVEKDSAIEMSADTAQPETASAEPNTDFAEPINGAGDDLKSDAAESETDADRPAFVISDTSEDMGADEKRGEDKSAGGTIAL